MLRCGGSEERSGGGVEKRRGRCKGELGDVKKCERR